MGQISLTLASSDYNRLKEQAQKNGLKPLTNASASLALMIRASKRVPGLVCAINAAMNANRTTEASPSSKRGVSVSVTISDDDLAALYAQAELNVLRPATYAASLISAAVNGQMSSPAAWEDLKQTVSSQNGLPLDRESIEKEFGPRTVMAWNARTQSLEERDSE
ncbi:MAG: hypothetical protein NT137_00180 [Methanomassiliicoccales archaeon]|nr:hypothetical protein [Methanomassiliicoccales archaeon]